MSPTTAATTSQEALATAAMASLATRPRSAAATPSGA